MKATAEQKEIAKRLKIKHSPNINAETLQMRIEQQPVAYKASAMKHVSERPVAAVYDNTPEEVLEAIKPYLKDGFDVKFPDDGTWYFSFKGREESGNLKIPLRIIKQKAENVSRGANKPRMMKFDGEVIFAG